MCKLLLFITLSFVVLNGFCYNKGTETKYILVINSYTEVNPWSSMIIDKIRTEISNPRANLDLYTESLNLPLYTDTSALTERLNKILNKYNEKAPAIIVLLGNSSWGLFQQTLETTWKNLPVIFCADERNLSADFYNIYKNFTGPVNYQSIEEIAGKEDITVIDCPVYIKETIDVMRQLIPHMEKLAFISDQRYLSIEGRKKMQDIVRDYYPELLVDYLTEGQLTLDQLIDTLKGYPDSVGIMYFSWVQKEIQTGNFYLSAHNHKTIVALTAHPMFTPIDVGINNKILAGGYVYSIHHLTQTLNGLLKEILAGKKISHWYSAGKPGIHLNYKVLEEARIPSSLYPKNAVYISKPDGFFVKYRYALISIAFLMLLLCMMYLRLRMLKQKENARTAQMYILHKFKKLVDNMPLGYARQKIIYNEKGEISDYEFLDVNKTFEKYFTDRDHLIGKKGSECKGYDFKEYLRIYELRNNCTTFTFEYFYPQQEKYYEIYAICIEKDFIDVFCIDVTNIRKMGALLEAANHKLALSLEVANIVPWKWDLENKTILCDVNRPIELQNVNINEEMLSVPEKEYFSKIHKEDRPRVEKAFHDLINGKSEKIKEEYRVLNKGCGHTEFEWVEAQATVDKHYEDGRPRTLIGSSLVISERKKMEQDLRDAKDRAEESNRLKSAFLANMSHEIRTPLNAIVGFSSILSTVEEEEEKKEYVNIIENNNDLLLQLISDILDLSKIESGVLKFTETAVNLKELMNEIVQTSSLKLKSSEVAFSFDTESPDCITATDKNRLMQVITNLVNNAIKFTCKGYIRFGYRLQNQNFLNFYVEDTGCGIPKEKQKAVFGRFIKLNNFAQGTGLGLSICEMIVHKLGGEIGVDSEVGKGSTFWFTLPYKPIQISKPPKAVLPSELEVVPKNKLKILIAEDNYSNYKLFESILKKDYQLLHAQDGLEAIELYTKFQPHLILMDINMPKMDGYEATREIRKLSQTVPIMAITAYAYSSDEEQIMQSGFDGYTSKPIQAAKLKEKIKTLLEMRLIMV